MATRKRNTAPAVTFSDLKPRVEALGYEVFGDNEAEHERGYYVLDRKAQTIPVESAGLSLKGLAEWLDEQQKERASRRGSFDLAALRRAVNRVVKAYRDGGQDLTIEFDKALEDLRKAVRAGGAA